MKGNDGTGNIIERDDWQTPQWIFDNLNNQYEFDFDCCASENNHKCKNWTDDFLNHRIIYLRSWMNPPFSKAKEMFKHFFSRITRGVAIYRCDNLETELWQDFILPYADWVFIPKGRISYEGKEGTGSRFPSALIGIGVPAPKGLQGVTLFVKLGEQEK